MSLVDLFSLFNGFLLSTPRKFLYKVERQLKLFTLPNSFIFLKHYNSYFQSLRPRPNVALFMRRTKLSELSSTSGSVKFVWMSLDRPRRSISPFQTDRTSDDRFRNKRQSSHATNSTKALVRRATKKCNLFSNIVAKRVEKRAFYHPRSNPVNNFIYSKTGLMWVIKRATSLFKSFCSNVARRVACFFLPVFPYLKK